MLRFGVISKSNPVKLIGILGRKQHGKDTIGNFFVKNYGFEKYCFAHPLKEACKIMFGFSNEQLNGSLKETPDPYWNVSPRKVMQYFGTELMRKQMKNIIPDIGEDFWVKSFERYYMEHKDDKFVITDVRFPNELQIIRHFGGTIIGVVRHRFEDFYFDQHESETTIDVNEADFIVSNDGSINDLIESLKMVTI
jgi:hypothetical protein